MNQIETAAWDRARAALTLMSPHAQRFDLCTAIREASNNHPATLSGYERERDQELRQRHSKHLQLGAGICVDGADLAPYLQRADTVSSAAAGGYLMQTQNVSFIELARPRSASLTLGATLLGDLEGNANFPRLTASPADAWNASETTGPSDVTQTFGQVAMSPRQVGVNIKLSRLLLLQSSPAASALIANDLLAGVAQAIDVGALAGSGSAGQPLGIVNTSAVPTVSGATLSNSGLVDMQGSVGTRLGTFGGYAAPIATAKVLAKRFRDATNVATYVWDGGLWGGTVAGNRAIATDNAPASTVIYGSWDQLLVGQWGPLQIEVSPFGTSPADFQAGLVSVRIITYVDIAVRDPKAFCVATSVT